MAFNDHIRYVRGYDPHEKLITNNFERADGTPFTKKLLPLAAREEWFLRDHPDGAIDRSRVEKDNEAGIVTAYACLVPDIRCPEVRYPEEEATVSLSVLEQTFYGRPHADLMGIAVNTAKSKAAATALKKAGYRLDEETEVDEGEQAAEEIEKADITAIESRPVKASPVPPSPVPETAPKPVPRAAAEKSAPRNGKKEPTIAEKKAAEKASRADNIRQMAAAMSAPAPAAPAATATTPIALAKTTQESPARPAQKPAEPPKEAKADKQAGEPRTTAPAPVEGDEAALEARYRELVACGDGRTLGYLMDHETQQNLIGWLAKNAKDEVQEGAKFLVRKYADEAHPYLLRAAEKNGLL